MTTMSLECAVCGYASPEGVERCPGCLRRRRTRPTVDPRTGLAATTATEAVPRRSRWRRLLARQS